METFFIAIVFITCLPVMILGCIAEIIISWIIGLFGCEPIDFWRTFMKDMWYCLRH